MTEQEVISPTPTWQGIPKELKNHIVKSLTVMDRSVIRSVSQTDRVFADTMPYDIDKIHIRISPTELKMKIFDTRGSRYEAPSVVYLSSILKNPKVEIKELQLESEQGPFGPWLTTLCKGLRKRKIEEGSLKVNKLTFVSTEYFQGFTLGIDISENEDIGYIVKLCKPQNLIHFHVDAKFSEDVWLSVIRTEQYKASETLEITKPQNFIIPLFNNWTGMHLIIKTTPQNSPVEFLRRKMCNLYKAKPLGASFRIRAVIDGVPLIPVSGGKYQNEKDPSIAAYVFWGPFFYNGFVRPSDETPDGPFECDEEETRHLPARVEPMANE